MLKIILGKIVPGLLRATSKQTKVVIAGGYSKGAGSKLVGIRSGIHFDVRLVPNPHARTLKGYNPNRVRYNRLNNSKSVCC